MKNIVGWVVMEDSRQINAVGSHMQKHGRLVRKAFTLQSNGSFLFLFSILQHMELWEFHKTKLSWQKLWFRETPSLKRLQQLGIGRWPHS